MILPCLFIAETEGKGRGVFTADKIAAETLVEISPVVVIPGQDRVHLDKTILHDYIFEWGIKRDQCCMALGWIPVYNHSYESNTEYFMDFENSMITLKTVRDISAGEEVTINYNGDWNDAGKVWFDVV